MFIKIRLVPRIRLTGGGYAKQPFSKSKHPRKSPPKREFINIGGEIAVLSNTAFLYEKDLNSGALTGKTYQINLLDLRARLPKKYKDKKCLDIICTLSSPLEFESEFENPDISQREYIYGVSRIHYAYAEDSDEVKESQNLDLDTSDNLNHRDSVINIKSQTNISQEFKNVKEIDSHNQVVFQYTGTREEVEKQITNYLQTIIGGDRELVTIDGDRIDLLTHNLLIEVKAARDWDNSIGQILKYKLHYPNHQLIIFLFDDGFSCEEAKSRLVQVIQKFINTEIHVISCVEELLNIAHND